MAGDVVRERIVAIRRTGGIVALPYELVAKLELVQSMHPAQPLRKIDNRAANRIRVLHAGALRTQSPRRGQDDHSTSTTCESQLLYWSDPRRVGLEARKRPVGPAEPAFHSHSSLRQMVPSNTNIRG